MTDSFFAPAPRKSPQQIQQEIDYISRSAILSGLLQNVGSMFSILNENRQILAVNTAFLEALELEDPQEILGLRPGEAFHCPHAQDMQAGCGTSPYCSTCGAAIAMVTSQEENRPNERICALQGQVKGRPVELALTVRSSPLEEGSMQLLLLILHDITLEQQRAALERTFFHDVNNMLAGLLGASELLEAGHQLQEMSVIIHQTAWRLKKEVDIQRALLKSDFGNFKPVLQFLDSRKILRELSSFFVNHPIAKGKDLKILYGSECYFESDQSLLLRVLCNMITNALEASDDGEEIRIWTEGEDKKVFFKVWNRRPIESHIALRIFQKNFSTKGGSGRGIGTYSMKLLGEQILGGTIEFQSSFEEGTLFSYSLPACKYSKE